MKRAAPERYMQTKQAINSLMGEHPDGVYVTATTEGEMQEPTAVTYRGVTREERLNPDSSPMPMGVIDISRLQDSPLRQQITIFVGPSAVQQMPLTGLPLEGIDPRFVDKVMHKLSEQNQQPSERQKRQSA